ncbi:hypothetical protein DE146DRAFT_452260 [Phaeosphaeria sp. MPI-PUGE-AT-0046c]|nr:hypothetical protein DE146DRAFT_452260 [Phaeosphaeria sp. MPI-PUGE-AT-0046c]
MPLSDGRHVVFIDPGEDMFVLGCDAPVGGPTKLLRRVFFIPPERNSVPVLFTAAIDLKHGARIVAVYGEMIMLYSVATDIIMDSRKDQEANSTTETAVPASGRTRDHWRNWCDSVPCETTKNIEVKISASLWPIAICGTEIEKLKGICEIAIQTQPDLTIWAFTHSSHCRTWRLRNYVDLIVPTEHFVCHDGGVHNLSLTNGPRDMFMGSSQTCPRNPGDLQHQIQKAEDLVTRFDGYASGYMRRIPKALAVENDVWVDLVDVRGRSDAWYDEGGDVVMLHGT